MNKVLLNSLIIATSFVLSLNLTSCTKNSSASIDEDDPYMNVTPLFNGDSLKEIYPLALEGNIIQQEDFENAMRTQILTHVGKHIECLEMQPWKVDKMMEFCPDSFYVSFERIIPGASITISTKLTRKDAALLDKYKWYEVTGIFTGFPPVERLQPRIYCHEIELGVYEFDRVNVKVYPEEKRNYWEKYIEDYKNY